MKLREFRPEDDAALISWIADADELYRFTGPRLTWPLDSTQLDSLRADPQFTMFTGLADDGAAVAHIELVSTGADSARIARVLVDPARQGQGLGEQLMREVLSEARRQGLASVSLFVIPGNTRAIRLYEKLGFEHRGESELLPGSLFMDLVLQQP